MSFFVNTRWGGSDHAPSPERMKEVLSELDHADPEHPDVCLTHESGWSLKAFETGLLVWENVESGHPPRHMRKVLRQHVLQLWAKLSEGGIDEIDREDWQPGYGD